MVVAHPTINITLLGVLLFPSFYALYCYKVFNKESQTSHFPAMLVPWTLLLSVLGDGLVPGAWGLATGSRVLSSLPPVADPGPCTPPTNSSAPVGLRGYQRFFPNASLIGRPVPCTRDDKICFRHNLIFDSVDDRCEPIGGGRARDCDLRPNRTEFERGGRMVGVCQPYRDPCSGYRMAFDGRCYRKEVVRDTICGCGVKPTRHFLEGVECGTSPTTPIDIQQPQEEGHCLIPDLRFPDVERSQFLLELQGVNFPRNRTRNDIPLNYFHCNSAQALCFAKKEVSVNGFSGCHPLLKQGPCPEEHIVALDMDSANRGQAEATCVHVRGGCPPGHKRMLFDGQCHEDREVAIEAPGYIDRNVYGENIVVPYHFRVVLSLSFDNGTCDLGLMIIAGGMNMGMSFPPCGRNNQGLCSLYEVQAEPPLPEL